MTRDRRISRVNRGRIPAILTMSVSIFLVVLFASSCGGGLTPEEEMRPLFDIGRAIRDIVDAVQLAFIVVTIAGVVVAFTVAAVVLVKRHLWKG